MRYVTSHFFRRLHPDGLTLLLVGSGVLVAGIVLLRQHAHGPYFSIDAVHYLAIARSLASGDGYVSFDGLSPANWPPGFASLMAVGSLFIFDPKDIVGPLNAVALGLTVFITGLWLRERIESHFLVLWGCLALVFSIPLVWVATYALSESVFILFLMLSLVYADRFLRSGSRSSLILAGLFGCLVCLLRYSGVPVVLAVAVMMMFSRSSAGLEKLRRVGFYVSISLLPLCLWMVRNVFVTGTFAGTRIQHEVRVLEDIYMVLKVLTVWLFQVRLQSHNPVYSEPILPFEGVMLWFSLACACVLTVVLWFVALRMFFQWRKDEAMLGRRVFVFLAGSMGLAYAGFLVFQPAVLSVITTVAEFLFPSYALDREEAAIIQTPISTRYVAPLYILLVVVAVHSLDRLLYLVRERERVFSLHELPLIGRIVRDRLIRIRLLSSLIIVGLSLWVCYGGYISALDTREAVVGEGYGRGTKSWRDSPVIEYVRTHLHDGAIFTNGPRYVYLNTLGHKIVRALAPTEELIVKFLDVGLPEFFEDYEEYYDSDDAYIVWMYSAEDLYSYGGADLRLRIPGLEPVAELSDGLVFKVNPSYDPSDAYDAFITFHGEVVSSEEPVIRSEFDVYIGEAELHYVKDPCVLSDIESLFFLHVSPVDVSDLPEERKEYGFDNLGFTFSRWGILSDGACLASVPLPEYAISRIDTGQYVSGGNDIWRERYSVATDDALSVFQELSGNGIEPAIRSVFNVYVDDRRLVYVKQQCTDQDRDTRFFLHVRPADADDLMEEGKGAGFDNLDFNLGEHGGESDGGCFAAVELPEYEIESISTGQFTADGRVWSEELEVGVK